MSAPDALVQANGEPVTLLRFVDGTIDRDGATERTGEYEQTVAIVSNPSEEDIQRLEGRLDEGGKVLTLQSDTNIQVERSFGPDHVALGHVDPATDDMTLYRVLDVKDDVHPLAGIRKLTASVDRTGGREDLPDVSAWQEAT